MAAFEVIALDTATPQLRAPGASDTYTFPRAVEMPLGTANGVLYLNGSKVVTSGSGLTFDSSGNLGLGVTPSAWNSSAKAFQLPYGAFWNVSDGVYLGTNYFLNSSAQRIYSNTGKFALEYLQYALDGSHRWYTAPSGTAGNVISFTQAMTLNSSGSLVVGATTANRAGANFGISAEGTSTSILEANINNGRAGYLYADGAATIVGEFRNSPLLFRTNDTERARIPAAGGMVVGTAALATTATDGFLYVPTCAGTPTGTPTTQTGTAPIVVDTTNNKLYFYSGGQWRDAGP